ncbi:MAG: hypothetical protein QOG54_2242 [Actinomycetota bacterium]|jgi:diguanylate cyclase (GGDEF)-like protein/PAS domain S-box-containing protein|nr:hypothetical protein [Actinomycetota bacterium]
MTFMGKSGIPKVTRAFLIALSIVTFAVIFAIRLAVDDPSEPVAFLMVIPIGLLAVELGLRGGLAGAGVASALVVAWDLISHPDLSPFGFFTRFFVFLASGVTVGLLISARRELQEESSRWFDQSLDLNIIANFEGMFVRVNRAFEQTLGYRERDLTTTPYIAFVHRDDREATQAIANALSEGKEQVDFENRYRGKDGSYHWLRWNASTDLAQKLIYASARDVTETRKLEEQLKELAQTDPLTGLFNRRHFESEAKRQLEFIRRYGPSAALFMFDIDRFKDINDSFGHSAGDEALARVAEILTTRARQTDICARIGGDEFAILLPGMDRSEAEDLANGLVTAIRRSGLGEGARRITSSLGIALFESPFETDLAGLLASADRAMYVAKRSGGDGFSFDGQQTISLV